jgi:molybdopterin-biosynthesis enzyme MoeA-like protein
VTLSEYPNDLTFFFPSQGLKRIEVIEDDESEIMEAVKRMSNRYDFVVTR